MIVILRGLFVLAVAFYMLHLVGANQLYLNSQSFGANVGDFMLSMQWSMIGLCGFAIVSLALFLACDLTLAVVERWFGKKNWGAQLLSALRVLRCVFDCGLILLCLLIIWLDFMMTRPIKKVHKYDSDFDRYSQCFFVVTNKASYAQTIAEQKLSDGHVHVCWQEGASIPANGTQTVCAYYDPKDFESPCDVCVELLLSPSQTWSPVHFQARAAGKDGENMVKYPHGGK